MAPASANRREDGMDTTGLRKLLAGFTLAGLIGGAGLAPACRTTQPEEEKTQPDDEDKEHKGHPS